MATNKFDETVAGLLKPADDKGAVLLLPQMPQIGTVLVEILETWCTQWSPKLFPYHEGLNWIHEAPYELPAVTSRLTDIEQIRSVAQENIARLEAEIDQIRDANSEWYNLLNGTGRDLVVSVLNVFTYFGFTRVIDVDEANVSGDVSDPQLREDIQILDTPPVLIVDVKGLGGKPTDADANQSEKHSLMRAKEFGGNVKPLTIINSQRNMAPQARDPNVFRSEIIENAKITGLALMTTLDLFWIRQNKDRLNWPPSVVMPIVYRTGRIDPYPEHYTEIATVVRTWKHSFGIVPSIEVRNGQRLAIEIDHLFHEFNIASLVVDDTTVDSAPAGSNCGIANPPIDVRIKQGLRVFLLAAVP